MYADLEETTDSPARNSPLKHANAKYRPLLFASAVFVFAVISYWYTMGYGFVWDDRPFIIDNAFIHDLKNFFRIFVSGDAVGTDPEFSNPFYRPVTTASFMLNFLLSGDNPAGFHLMNLLLHATVCALLFTALNHLLKNAWAAFISAALFCVHPANLEPIAYISARADLVCGVFLLLGFISYLKFRDERKNHLYYISLLAFAVAVFAKIVAILFPLLLLIDLREKKLSWPRIIPFFIISVVFNSIRVAVTEVDSFYGSTWDMRFATAPTLVARYIANTVFPFMLGPFYSIPAKTTFLDFEVIASWLLLLGIGAGMTWAFRKHRTPVLGLIWYFLFLLPSSGFYILLAPSYIADRYLYIPMLGMAITTGWLLIKVNGTMIRSRLHRYAAISLVVVSLAGLVFYNYGKSFIWENNLAFWGDALKQMPGNPYVKLNYGESLIEFNYHPEAYHLFSGLKESGDENPYNDYFIAKSLIGLSDIDNAKIYASIALYKLPQNATFMALLGKISLMLGEYNDSMALCTDALRLDPWQKDARETLQSLDKLQIRPPQAISRR
jgi:hypothetical protein